MIFAIVQSTNLSQEQNSWVNDLSADLKSFFDKRNYGKDLNELYFGLITVKPEFDQFFKKRRPRYKPGERTSVVDGIEVKSTNCVEVDVKIEFSEVSQLKKAELIEKVCKEILIEVPSLTRLSKLKDFDYDAFTNDFEDHLVEKKYIEK